MDTGIIAIMDSEEAYAVKLADYFKAKSGLGYNVQVFTNIHSFLDFEKTNFTDILIISEIYGDYVADLKNTGQVYILSEGSIDIKLTEYCSIYKYQSTENIIRDVMTNYVMTNPASTALHKSRISLKTATSKLLSVYSPVKRCGKTTFALVLGCLLAKTEPALYLSFEEYSCLSFYTGTQHTGDLSDLLYFYRQNPDNLDKKLLSLSHSLHNMDYIPPIHFSLDLKYMNGEDWCGFINDIAAIGKYTHIILDISDSLTDIYELLSISDTIYFPILNDALSLEKVNNFKKTLCLLGKNAIVEKLKEISLPEINITAGDSPVFNSLLYGSYGLTVQKIIEAYEK